MSRLGHSIRLTDCCRHQSGLSLANHLSGVGGRAYRVLLLVPRRHRSCPPNLPFVFAADSSFSFPVAPLTATLCPSLPFKELFARCHWESAVFFSKLQDSKDSHKYGLIAHWPPGQDWHDRFPYVIQLAIVSTRRTHKQLSNKQKNALNATALNWGFIFTLLKVGHFLNDSPFMKVECSMANHTKTNRVQNTL